MKTRKDEIQCKACGMVHYSTESVCENCKNPLREDIPTPKENLKEKYAVYDCDGNLKGYYVTDEELDDFAVASSSDTACKHTELTRQLFCEKIGAEDLNYIDSGEYEITFKELRKEQVETFLLDEADREKEEFKKDPEGAIKKRYEIKNLESNV